MVDTIIVDMDMMGIVMVDMVMVDMVMVGTIMLDMDMVVTAMGMVMVTTFVSTTHTFMNVLRRKSFLLLTH